MRESTKGWLKTAVVAFGVLDCVGIYAAQQRLARPVPADTGNDLAYALPADIGVFRPDRAMPAPGVKAVPTVTAVPAAKAALAMTAPVAPLAAAAPAIAPLHRDGAAPPATVKLARIEAAAPHAAPDATTHAAAHAAAHPATGAPAKLAVTTAAPAPLAGLVSHRSHDRLFADAFSALANVPLDAPITMQLDDASSRAALADDGGPADVQLAHNSGPAPTAHDSAGSGSSAAALPEAGPAAILPDSDVL